MKSAQAQSNYARTGNTCPPIPPLSRVLGIVVCAGKRTCISQDTLRRNRRAVTFGDIP